MQPSVRRALAVAGFALAAACVSAPDADTAPPPPPPKSEWQSTRETAQRLTLDGRYAEADSLLRAFERRAAAAETVSSGELAESRFHRMLLRVDPSNPVFSTDSAMAAIDQYLSGGSGQARYQEALVLRRLTGELGRMQNLPPPQPIVLGDTVLLRQRTEEAARLRDSLERTSAELERIRRRLRATRPDSVR
jgi:hypothetical protein